MGDSAKKLEDETTLESQSVDKTFDELEDSFNREFSSQSTSQADLDLQAELNEFDGLSDVGEPESILDNETDVSAADNPEPQIQENQEYQEYQEEQLELESIDLEPEVVESSQHKTKTASNTSIKTRASWPMRITVATALFGVIGIAGYGYLNHEQVKNQLIGLSTTITTLTTDASATAQKQVALDEIMSRLNVTSEKLLKEAQLTNTRVSNIALQLNTLTQTVNGHTEALQLAQQDLASLRLKVNELDKQFDDTYMNLDGKVKAIEKRVTPRSNNASPVFNVANNIEGATLESVDTWNNLAFVNLRDSNGKWVSLQAGQSYKGWVVKSIEDSKVIFNRGGKSGQNKVLSPIK